MSTKVLVSIVSMIRLEPHLGLLPGCLFRRPADLITDALEIGYSGVQAIPIRGLTGEEPNIGLFEDAWYTRRWRTHIDWVLFPKISECNRITGVLRNRQIPQIHHSFERDNKLVEVSLALDMTAEEIVAQCEATVCVLVLDTSHIRRSHRPDEIVANPNLQGKPSPFGVNVTEWKRVIKTLAPYIAVIHVNPGDDPVENEAFTASTNPFLTITGQLLAYTLEQAGDNIEYIVSEHRPLLRAGRLDRAEKMFDTIKSYLK